MAKRLSFALTGGYKLSPPRVLYFVIFAISGFSGLIYESIWSHYLKLFLGHAAYAQSLVLIIFMGGMALGSWAASRYLVRRTSPFVFYVAVELIVGLAALLFHELFVSLISIFYTSVLSSTGSPAVAVALKWMMASVLIMPQSVLLGMTFPLMSAGVIRRYPGGAGSIIAMLYFTNSIGAAVGVVVSGFWLIGVFGLPGTIFIAGLINIALALTVWGLIRLDTSTHTTPTKREQRSEHRSSRASFFLFAAAVTGIASFIYEVSWIRMLSMVLGASTHSFELMLSAFITGLAFGGLWIRKRIDRITFPVRYSGYVQLVIGISALLTIPIYASSFNWMEWILQALRSTDAGYVGYSVGSHTISLMVMLPTTFMAGMTLPLFTSVLLRQGHGEKSIGQVYAANTIGAILGVIFAVHVGLPLLGLKYLIVVGAMLNIGLGLIMLAKNSISRVGKNQLSAAIFIGIGSLILTIVTTNLNTSLLTSSIFRTGSTDSGSEGSKVIFYQDGKTASISLFQSRNGVLSLQTNGKTDASIQLDLRKSYVRDQLTQYLAAALPLAYLPESKQVAIIGLGSGLTSHAMLAHEGIVKVDTIEIESVVASASRGYGEAVERVYSDSRSEIHIDDAKTFFSLHQKVYDIIIAEPSNPWVSGVANLFTIEFYETIKRYLPQDGVFVQWVQLYEFNDELVISILKALSEAFPDYVVYTTDGSNIVLIARKSDRLPEPDWSSLLTGRLAKELARLDIKSKSDLLVRKIIGRKHLYPYLAGSVTPTNSDYFPFVDLNAERARFKDSRAKVFAPWIAAPLPVLEMLGGELLNHTSLTDVTALKRVRKHFRSRWIHRQLTRNATHYDKDWKARRVSRSTLHSTKELQHASSSCDLDSDVPRFHLMVHNIMAVSLPFLDAATGIALVDKIASAKCTAQQERLSLLWFDLYRAVARRDATNMSSAAHRLLVDDAEMAPVLKPYLVIAAMLGHITSGSPEQARAVWDRYSQKVFGDRKLPEYVKLVSRIANHRGDTG